jgi:hypothetical protein
MNKDKIWSLILEPWTLIKKQSPAFIVTMNVYSWGQSRKTSYRDKLIQQIEKGASLLDAKRLSKK